MNRLENPPPHLFLSEARSVNPVGEKGVVGELLETYDLTTQFQHGWALDYRIRRDDGEEVHAEVRCWDRARETAEHHGNTAALDAIADRGVAAALALAESAESPASRGAVVISIWFDQADAGSLRSRVIYERPGV